MPVPESRDRRMAGKPNTGQFYRDISVQEGALHLVRTEQHHIDNTRAPMIYASMETHQHSEQSQYLVRYLKIKRAHYLSRPVINPVNNNLLKLSDTHSVDKGHLNTRTHIYQLIDRRSVNSQF